MAHGSGGSGRLVVHLCTVNGVVQRFHRVQTWLFRDGKLIMFRDDRWEDVKLERRHIGAYATGHS